MSDWSGYEGDWLFADWENEVLTVSSPPASGATLVERATNVEAKANREKKGMEVSGAGVVTIAYERRFYFAASYTDGAGNTNDPRNDGGVDLLDEGNVLTDADGKSWTITATANPGGADEHYEVDAVRRRT
jgi:hypothetical protein